MLKIFPFQLHAEICHCFSFFCWVITRSPGRKPLIRKRYGYICHMLERTDHQASWDVQALMKCFVVSEVGEMIWVLVMLLDSLQMRCLAVDRNFLKGVLFLKRYIYSMCMVLSLCIDRSIYSLLFDYLSIYCSCFFHQYVCIFIYVYMMLSLYIHVYVFPASSWQHTNPWYSTETLVTIGLPGGEGEQNLEPRLYANNYFSVSGILANTSADFLCI